MTHSLPSLTQLAGIPLQSRVSIAKHHARTAITYGTFDLFHVGHVRLFRRIKEKYGHLIVAVSTDEFNTIKGKKSVMKFADRVELVRSCRWVDLVIAETSWEQKEQNIAYYSVDAFVMGDDWSGKFDYLSKLCEVIYMPRTEGVSSTMLRSQARHMSAHS
jgi:glycerol-3-phosphate cytidylyltransferase